MSEASRGPQQAGQGGPGAPGTGAFEPRVVEKPCGECRGTGTGRRRQTGTRLAKGRHASWGCTAPLCGRARFPDRVAAILAGRQEDAHPARYFL